MSGQTAPTLLLWALLLVSFGVAMQSYAQSNQSQQLEALSVEIAALEERLTAQSSDLSALQQQLKALAREQNLLAQNRRSLAVDIRDHNNQLKKLNQTELELNRRVAQQRQEAAMVIAAHYKLGRQPQLKLLLNHQQHTTVKRHLAYYRYLVTARYTLLQALNRDLVQLTAVHSQLRQKLHELEVSQSEQQAIETKLKQSIAKQQQRSSQLNQQINSQRGQLTALQEQRQQLERVLQEAAKRRAPRLPSKPFAELKGALPKPAPGRLLHRFGERRGDQLRWQGWLIDARRGDPVAAIHSGRVVYADYLRGYGLLVIVEHDAQTLSLYAHNSELSVEQGEQISAQTVIAYAGDSGEAIGNALYFELRRDGLPVDPAEWLR
ncbi:peptidoglycan DD-metalloendopeptidase family protein [Porticoccaceae bacterium]|nr:peptidoglycan DD-metalloendopeptidase family protein [Porticoccaceae bacterium]